MRGVWNGASLVFFSYIGFDAIATTAEEVLSGPPHAVLILLMRMRLSTSNSRFVVSHHAHRHLHQLRAALCMWSVSRLVFLQWHHCPKGRLTCHSQMQVKNPGRDIPLGMTLALCVVTTLYLLCACVPVSSNAFSSLLAHDGLAVPLSCFDRPGTC